VRRDAARIVALSASTLDDIFEGVMRVTRAMDLTERGQAASGASVCAPRSRAAAHLRQAASVRGSAGVDRPGEPLRGNDRLYSPAIPADQLREADPEFLIVAPRGFDLERSRRERTVLELLPWWHELKAVQEGRVAFAHGNRLFDRSGMTVAEAAEVLAEILHGGPAESVYWRWYTNPRVQAS
jgi:iron complex transport system substrate-binding protein